MQAYLENVLQSLSYLAACYLLFFIGKLVYSLFHSKIKIGHELVEKDNFAFAVAHIGYFVGLLLAIGSAVVGPSHGFVEDLIDIGIYGLLSILLLNISIFITHKVILRKFNVTKEIIEDQNVGTGVVEAAVCIANGLIILGAVSGEGGNIYTALGVWGIGQVILFVASLVYNLILPYDIHEHIEKDNVAVGIGFAGVLIALGNLTCFGASGDFESWELLLEKIGINVGLGLILLPIIRWGTDKLLLPGRTFTDEIINQEKPNCGVALLEAFAYISSSVLISWCL